MLKLGYSLNFREEGMYERGIENCSSKECITSNQDHGRENLPVCFEQTQISE